MQQDKFKDLIPFYVARTLSQPEQREFEARLAVDEGLRREVEEWRMIAAAVWREADTVARKLPPLSPEVYQRLAYRGKTPQSTYPAAAIPGEQTLRQPRIRLTQTTSVPLTLVAGLVLAFLFGGLLVLIAINTNNRPQPIIIAENVTGTPGDGGFGAAITATGTPAAVSTDFGIIQASPGVLVPPTNTPVSEERTPLPSVPGTATLTTNTQLISPLSTQAVRPVITPAPGECLLINASMNPVTVYTAARADADKLTELIPGDQYLTPVQSADGWYEIFIAPGNLGWVFASDVVTTGDCNTLPVATPTLLPTSTMLPIQLTIPATAEIAIVTAPFADLRRGPSIGYEVVSTVGQNTQFAVRGYFGGPDSQWILTALNDGSDAWLSVQSVQISPVGSITPPPNATPQ